MPPTPRTRRWQRHPVDLPVRVLVANTFSTTIIPGRSTELSEGGMALYAGVQLNPGDLMEVEFEIPCRSRMIAVVRQRSGFSFGVEFAAPLSS